MGRLDLAEDVVQETLCRALEIWPVHGVPENPSAWLMRVARNRAIDLVTHDEQFRHFATHPPFGDSVRISPEKRLRLNTKSRTTSSG